MSESKKEEPELHLPEIERKEEQTMLDCQAMAVQTSPDCQDVAVQTHGEAIATETAGILFCKYHGVR